MLAALYRVSCGGCGAGVLMCRPWRELSANSLPTPHVGYMHALPPKCEFEVYRFFWPSQPGTMLAGVDAACQRGTLGEFTER